MLSLLSVLRNRSVWFERSALILFGALYPLGFAPIDFWPLTILSLGLLINEIISKAEVEIQDPALSSRHSYFAIIFFWCIGAFGVGVSWVYVSIHEFGHVPMIGAVAISFLLVLTLSVIKGLAGPLIKRFTQQVNPSMLLLFLPFVWVVFEFVQTFIFSGFPWLFAGYSQMDGPFSQLATWFGVYGISWFVIAVTTAVVFILRKWLASKALIEASNNKLRFSNWVLCLAIFLSFPLLAYLNAPAPISTTKSTIDVALVQPNVPQEQKWDRQYFSNIINILYQQSEQHWQADLIVWPEGAIPAYQHQVKDILADLDKRARESNTDLLLGLPIYEPEPRVSYSALISLGQHQDEYHKQVLVPFGEYVPLGKYLRGLIKFLNLPMSSFSPANAEQKAIEFADYQVIPAICYEIAYPDIVHQLARGADNDSTKAKLLVTVSNDAWFGDSLGPYQHMQMARMRALELGMPLVRSTNDGITAVVDAKGFMLAKIARYQQQTLRFKVNLTNYQTLYRAYGLYAVYLLLSINFVVLMLIYFRQNK
jgi:apolipoprotein N-acyltransferase